MTQLHHSGIAAAKIISSTAQLKHAESPTDLSNEARLEQIRNRLRSEIPAGIYLNDQDVAPLMGITVKRLRNLRAEKKNGHDTGHPPFVRLEGRRGVRYVREVLIEFFALQELQNLGRYLHRCK